MEIYAICATMKAKEGRERDVENFLERLLRYAEGEEGIKHLLALRGHDRTYSIFDRLEDRRSRAVVGTQL